MIESALFACDRFFCDLVIERQNGRKCVGDITMTNLKMMDCSQFINCIENQLKRLCGGGVVERKEMFKLKHPYLLRAQNRLRRASYKYSGAQYGETDSYCIVGAYIHDRQQLYNDYLKRNQKI